MFNLILFGPPGSGKGTQSKKIAEKYNLVHLSTGDVFRKEIREESKLGLKIKSIVEKGELVPDELLIDVLENEINKNSEARGIIFDGFPRTIKQAEDLEQMMNRRNDEIDLVLVLKVNDNEVISRLLKRAEIEGRKDDTKEVIENRLEVYKNQTQPLIDFYENRGKVEEVEGIGTIDEIFGSICGVIDSRI